MARKGKDHNRKQIPAVYFLLRLLTVLVMMRQICRGNWGNVYLCLLTLLLFAVPAWTERKLGVVFSPVVEITVLLFVFASEILGEVHACYLRIPCWDMVLHGVSGFLFAAIGFSFGAFGNRRENTEIPPVFRAVMALSFSVTIGVLWEFLEWGMDLAFGLDMQKDTVLSEISSVCLNAAGHNKTVSITGIGNTMVTCSDGANRVLGVGGYLDIGLHDTMWDLLVNFLGASIFSVPGYFYALNPERKSLVRHFILKPKGER